MQPPDTRTRIVPGWPPAPSRVDREGVTGWAIGLSMLLLVLAAADLLVPARSDLLAISRVFAPHLAILFVPLGLLAILGRRGRWRLLGILAVVGIAVGLVRFLPPGEGRARAADPTALQVHLATWNLELGAVPVGTLVDELAARAPAIIGLEELTPDAAEVIGTDPVLRRRFPHQDLRPTRGWDGMGLLSSWPMDAESARSELPPLIQATITLEPGTSLDVIAVHAPPPIYPLGAFGPGYDATSRDASLRVLRDRLDESIEAGRRVVLLGDLNLTDREAAYAELVAGLTDAHRVVGDDMGHTWRPLPLKVLPFGLLRIDMVLAGPGVVPLSSVPDCTPGASDHCLLDVLVELGAAGQRLVARSISTQRSFQGPWP